ncbi:hydrogenase maturation protein, partial [Streptomyces sp. NPDC029006]
ATALATAPDLDGRIAAKAAARAEDERERPLADHRQAELARMHAVFFDPSAPYHALRSAFVRKTPAGSPRPLAPAAGDAR